MSAPVVVVPMALALLATFAVAAQAQAQPSSSAPKYLRVALYNDSGASSESATDYYHAVQGFIAEGTLNGDIRIIDKATVADVSAANTDVVMFPGGSGDGQFAAIGLAGQRAVTTFVNGGGGYVGTCGGGFLAVPGRCCKEDVAKDYCGGHVGCRESNQSIAIVAGGAKEPWDRGHGNVTIQLTADAVKELQLPQSWATEPVHIVYWQGPIMEPFPNPEKPDLPAYLSRAKFTSEINTKHPQWTTGEMLGADAIVTTTYGKGRVLISSPHPEHPPQVLPLIHAYVRWAGRII